MKVLFAGLKARKSGNNTIIYGHTSRTKREQEANSIFHFATKTIRECCLGIRDSYKDYHFHFILDDTVPNSIPIEEA